MNDILLDVLGSVIDLNVGNITVSLDISETAFTLPEEAYNVEVDLVTDWLIYKGETFPGNETSDPFWRIQKIVVSMDSEQDVTVTWAEGNGNFDKIWDNHLNLNYS